MSADCEPLLSQKNRIIFSSLGAEAWTKRACWEGADRTRSSAAEVLQPRRSVRVFRRQSCETRIRFGAQHDVPRWVKSAISHGNRTTCGEERRRTMGAEAKHTAYGQACRVGDSASWAGRQTGQVGSSNRDFGTRSGADPSDGWCSSFAKYAGSSASLRARRPDHFEPFYNA